MQEQVIENPTCMTSDMDIYHNFIFKDIGNMINSHVQTLILEKIRNLCKIFKGYADVKNNNISEYCFLVL